MLIYQTLHSRDFASGGNSLMAIEHPTKQAFVQMHLPISIRPVSFRYCTLIVATPQVFDDVHVSFFTGGNTELTD